MTASPLAENAERYGYLPVAASPTLYPGERLIFDELVRPGMTALDLGSGAGRVALDLLDRGLTVTACDLIEPALDALRAAAPPDAPLEVVAADARALPFADGSFDLVVFAFNGLDWISPEADRAGALREMARVARPGGIVVLSSHNPVGALLTPRGVRSPAIWRWRLGHLARGGFMRRYAPDPSGLLVCQTTPRRALREARDGARLEPVLVVGASGRSRSVGLLTLFSAWPYYVFRKAV